MIGDIVQESLWETERTASRALEKARCRALRERHRVEFEEVEKMRSMLRLRPMRAINHHGFVASPPRRIGPGVTDRLLTRSGAPVARRRQPPTQPLGHGDTDRVADKFPSSAFLRTCLNGGKSPIGREPL